MKSIRKLEKFKKFIVDPSFHHQDHCELTVAVYQQVYSLFVLSFMDVSLILVNAEVHIKRINFYFGLKPRNGSCDSHFSIGLLVIDVLNDHSSRFIDIWVTACKIVQLLKHPLSLGNVATYSFDQVLFLLIKFPLNSNFSIWQNNHRQVM